MKKLSEIITKNHIPHFPAIGRDGYGGEIDGTRVLSSDVLYFRSMAEMEKIAVPDYVRQNWAEYRPGHGWEVVLACWSDEPEAGDGNPFCMD